MERLLGLDSSHLILGSVLLIVVCWVYSNRFHPTIPSELPWIGKDSTKILAETRAHMSSFNRVREWLKEGYEKYSKKDITYVFPDFSGRPEVIIPRSEMRWLLEQPESVLSVAELHNDILAGPYAFTHPQILKDPFHEHVIHRTLARRIPPLIMDVWDELACAIDESWGKDTQEWKEICLFENMNHVIARASNRVFVGLPLCRNKTYLKAMANFAQDIINTTLLLRFTPKLLEPLFGHLFAIPNHIHHNQTLRLLRPFVDERLINIEKKDSDPSFEWEEPNDYLTWHIRLAMAENNSLELDPNMICRRLLPVNFGAIHTTVFTITNCFFDLLSTPAQKFNGASEPLTALEVIRDEARSNFVSSGKVWTKPVLNRLIYADSALRESMRGSNVLTRGLLRKVVAEDGLENKKLGWKVPHGTFIGMDVHSVMHDPEIYPNPESFDAFRFARARNSIEGNERSEEKAEGNLKDQPIDEKSQKVRPEMPNGSRSSKAGNEVLESQKLGMSTTSGTFLPFGHGRHACPGRFLVSHELKMLLAYTSMHYEIEPLDERPPNTWFGQNVIPPMKATIRVRRREPEKLGI